MSYAYGSLARSSGDRGDQIQSTRDKYLAAVAALVPADILGLHAFLLLLTTNTDEAGTTTITDETLLGYGLFVLLGTSVVLFVFGHGLAKWTPRDFGLLLIPLVSFLAWAALLGTSALTPWVESIPRNMLLFGAAIAAVVVIAANAALTKPVAPPPD